MVAYAISQTCALDDIPLPVLKGFSEIIEEDFFEAISLSTCVKERKTIGAPGLARSAVEKAKAFVETL